MVPSTFAAVVVFVLLVTPGIVFELLWQRTWPRRDESTFVEIGRVLLAGVVFSGVAVAVVSALAGIAPGTAADVVALVRDGQGYVAGHAGLTLGTLVTVVLLAMCLAVAAHDLSTSRTPRRIAQETVWHTAFGRMAGPGVRVFLSVQLKDGTTVTGHVAGYSTEPDPARRDLLLAAPLAIRRPEQATTTLLAEGWQTFVVPGAEISTIAVSYVSRTPPLTRPGRRQRALGWVGRRTWQFALGAGLVVLVLQLLIARS